jgi:hypothetical protein
VKFEPIVADTAVLCMPEARLTVRFPQPGHCSKAEQSSLRVNDRSQDAACSEIRPFEFRRSMDRFTACSQPRIAGCVYPVPILALSAWTGVGVSVLMLVSVNQSDDSIDDGRSQKCST